MAAYQYRESANEISKMKKRKYRQWRGEESEMAKELGETNINMQK